MSTSTSPSTATSTTGSRSTTTESTTDGRWSSTAEAATAPPNDSPASEETETQQAEAQSEETSERAAEDAAETEGGGNAEAAKYRRRLRDTEARVEELITERDEATRALAALRDTIAAEALEDALQDRVVDEEMRRIVLDQVNLADFRTEAGTVDRRAVADYAQKFTPPVTGWTFTSAGQDRDARGLRSGTSWSKILGNG